MPLHPAGLLYVFLVGLYAPFLAVRSARRLATMKGPPSRALAARSAFVSFALMGVLSWLTARAIGIPWAVVRWRGWSDLLLVAGGLALLFAWAPFSWRRRGPAERARLVALLPETPGQAVVWVVMGACAGVFEEIAWRGVLFANVGWLVHSPWLAAILGSVSFGVAHAYQGRRGMVAIGIVGLLMHALVALSGSLLPAMLVHGLYDVGVGFLFRALARRDGTIAAAA